MASPRANPPVRAIVATDFTDHMRRPLSWEVKKRLRDQTERIEERDTDQGPAWGNEQGFQTVDMLSRLESIITANTQALQKCREERDAFQEKMEAYEVKIGEHEVKIWEHEAKSKEERSAFEAKIGKHEAKSKEERSAFEAKIGEHEAKSKEERSAFEAKIGEHEAKSKEERSALEAKIGKHEAEIEKLTRKAEDHAGKIGDLTLGSKGYFEIRARFLCVYRRDHGKGKERVPEDLKSPERPEVPTDSSIIEAGNRKAHYGDAAMDAIVCRDSDPKMSHKQTFSELYYIDYEKALKLDAAVRAKKMDEQVFWILDRRGTLVAAGKSFSKELEEAFITYIDGIFDDRGVVTERGKNFWRISRLA